MSLGVGEARNTRRSTKQSTGTVLNELEDYSRNLKASPSAGDFAKIRTLDRLVSFNKSQAQRLPRDSSSYVAPGMVMPHITPRSSRRASVAAGRRGSVAPMVFPKAFPSISPRSTQQLELPTLDDGALIATPSNSSISYRNRFSVLANSPRVENPSSTVPVIGCVNTPVTLNSPRAQNSSDNKSKSYFQQVGSPRNNPMRALSSPGAQLAPALPVSPGSTFNLPSSPSSSTLTSQSSSSNLRPISYAIAAKSPGFTSSASQMMMLRAKASSKQLLRAGAVLLVDDEDVHTCVDDLLQSFSRNVPHLPVLLMPQSAVDAESARLRSIQISQEQSPVTQAAAAFAGTEGLIMTESALRQRSFKRTESISPTASSADEPDKPKSEERRASVFGRATSTPPAVEIDFGSGRSGRHVSMAADGRKVLPKLSLSPLQKTQMATESLKRVVALAAGRRGSLSVQRLSSMAAAEVASVPISNQQSEDVPSTGILKRRRSTVLTGGPSALLPPPTAQPHEYESDAKAGKVDEPESPAKKTGILKNRARTPSLPLPAMSLQIDDCNTDDVDLLFKAPENLSSPASTIARVGSHARRRQSILETLPPPSELHGNEGALTLSQRLPMVQHRFPAPRRMSMSAAGRNMIRKTKLAFRGKVLVKPPTIAVAAEDEVQGAVFEPESPRSRSILVERQQALERAEDDIRNQQANERARIIRELRQADELQEALENVSNTQTLRQANELLWNRISYAVALTGAQDFAHAVESGVQADKDRQLQLVMSRSGAYKGGFALPPTAVRQMFPPFDPEYDDERDEETPRWVRIAKQPPDVRKLEDIVFLAKQLKRLELSFLAECGFHTVLEVARSVRLETYYRDQRVFLEGEPGEKLFIVITGQVAAWKRVPPPKKGAPDPALLNALVPGSVKVATMPEGTVFGEISLLRNAPRAATIMVASNYAHFLTLTRREWVALLRLDHRRSLAEKLDFFSTHDMFKSWPNLKLLSFVNCLRERHYQRGMSVFRAGDPSEFVYFIRRGDVAVCLSSDLINNTGAQTNTDDASVEESKLGSQFVLSQDAEGDEEKLAEELALLQQRINKKKKQQTKHADDHPEAKAAAAAAAAAAANSDSKHTIQIQSNITTAASSTILMDVKSNQAANFEVAILTTGDVLGEAGALSGQQRSAHAVCRNKVVLYEMDREDFLRMITAEQLDNIRRVIKLRQTITSQLMNSIRAARTTIRRSRLTFLASAPKEPSKISTLPPLPSTAVTAILAREQAKAATANRVHKPSSAESQNSASVGRMHLRGSGRVASSAHKQSNNSAQHPPPVPRVQPAAKSAEPAPAPLSYAPSESKLDGPSVNFKLSAAQARFMQLKTAATAPITENATLVTPTTVHEAVKSNSQWADFFSDVIQDEHRQQLRMQQQSKPTVGRRVSVFMTARQSVSSLGIQVAQAAAAVAQEKIARVEALEAEKQAKLDAAKAEREAAEASRLAAEEEARRPKEIFRIGDHLRPADKPERDYDNRFLLGTPRRLLTIRSVTLRRLHHDRAVRHHRDAHRHDPMLTRPPPHPSAISVAVSQSAPDVQLNPHLPSWQSPIPGVATLSVERKSEKDLQALLDRLGFKPTNTLLPPNVASEAVAQENEERQALTDMLMKFEAEAVAKRAHQLANSLPETDIVLRRSPLTTTEDDIGESFNSGDRRRSITESLVKRSELATSMLCRMSTTLGAHMASPRNSLAVPIVDPVSEEKTKKKRRKLRFADLPDESESDTSSVQSEAPEVVPETVTEEHEITLEEAAVVAANESSIDGVSAQTIMAAVRALQLSLLPPPPEIKVEPKAELKVEVTSATSPDAETTPQAPVFSSRTPSMLRRAASSALIDQNAAASTPKLGRMPTGFGAKATSDSSSSNLNKVSTISESTVPSDSPPPLPSGPRLRRQATSAAAALKSNIDDDSTPSLTRQASDATMSDDSDSYQHDDSEEEEEEHEKEEDYDVYAHSVYAPPTMTPRPSFRNPNLVIPDEEDEASAESCGAMDIEARAVLSRAQLDHLANSVENHMRHPHLNSLGAHFQRVEVIERQRSEEAEAEYIRKLRKSAQHLNVPLPPRRVAEESQPVIVQSSVVEEPSVAEPQVHHPVPEKPPVVSEFLSSVMGRPRASIVAARMAAAAQATTDLASEQDFYNDETLTHPGVSTTPRHVESVPDSRSVEEQIRAEIEANVVDDASLLDHDQRIAFGEDVFGDDSSDVPEDNSDSDHDDGQVEFLTGDDEENEEHEQLVQREQLEAQQEQEEQAQHDQHELNVPFDTEPAETSFQISVISTECASDAEPRHSAEGAADESFDDLLSASPQLRAQSASEIPDVSLSSSPVVDYPCGSPLDRPATPPESHFAPVEIAPRPLISVSPRRHPTSPSRAPIYAHTSPVPMSSDNTPLEISGRPVTFSLHHPAAGVTPLTIAGTSTALNLLRSGSFSNSQAPSRQHSPHSAGPVLTSPPSVPRTSVLAHVRQQHRHALSKAATQLSAQPAAPSEPIDIQPASVELSTSQKVPQVLASTLRRLAAGDACDAATILSVAELAAANFVSSEPLPSQRPQISGVDGASPMAASLMASHLKRSREAKVQSPSSAVLMSTTIASITAEHRAAHNPSPDKLSHASPAVALISHSSREQVPFNNSVSRSEAPGITVPPFISMIAPAELLAPPAISARLLTGTTMAAAASPVINPRRVEEQLYTDAHEQFDMATRLRGTAFAQRPLHSSRTENRNRL